MKHLACVLLLALIPVGLTAQAGSIPSVLIGSWNIGKSYEGPQPVGLNANQEKSIIGIHVRFAESQITECGKTIKIQSIKNEVLTEDEFLQKYGFLPRMIGLGREKVLELSINDLNFTSACGDFEDPGTHVFIGKNNHVVIEIANDYFPLKRISKRTDR